MERESKNRLIRIIIAAALLGAAYFADARLTLPLWGSLLLYLPAYLTVGGEVLAEAGGNLLHGEVFDEDFLMSVATLGALAIGFLPDAEPQFPEAVFVMLFFQVGELFEELAAGRSRRSIAELMDIRPDSADCERNGEVVTLPPEEVAVGEIIVIKPGAKVPIDGVVIEGSSSLDTAALTGESVPRVAAAGDDIISGCVNLTGLLRVRTTKAFGESTASRILELVENAADKKSKSEKFITRFSRVYTPAVVGAALVLALLPPLLSGDFSANAADWIRRALTFLVVSCPCALVISVPLAFFGGIGGAAKQGVLIKGSDFLETLSRTGVAVFDKTGTLTEGVFEVTAVHPEKCDGRQLLHIAAHVERFSNHPIAVSLRRAYADEADACEVGDLREIAGKGVCARVNGREVSVGNPALMEQVGAVWKPCEHTGTIVHVAIEGEYAGHIVISDRLKEDAAEAVAALRAEGVEKIIMLTGDRAEVGAEVAAKLGLDGYRAGLLPDGKVSCVEELLGERSPGKSLVFVGDGINDAPVLARADVGIAMGAMGSDAAVEAADVVLMNDEPSKIAQAVGIARRTLRIARENIVFALTVKLAVLVMAVFGVAPMWLAVFADVGVTVLAVLNSSRALGGKKK